MKIVYLAAGAGSMYCGSCMHGNTLVAALRAAGEDCLLAPLYTPLRTDEAYVGTNRVAFGGINVYLQQHSSLFRHTPWAFDRLLDRPGLLRWATSRSASVQPTQLGPLTVSMLEGEHGRQRKEVLKLVDWLSRYIQPDIVHLNNAMLLGVAGEIKRTLGIPVVCSLSGEDSFLEKLLEPYHERALAVLQKRCGDVASLVAMNRYYATFMADYLRVPPERIHVVPAGLNLSGHGTRRPDNGTPTIGYLARICPDKGLHLLGEAVRLLAADTTVPQFRVRAAGYLDAADRPYLARVLRDIDEAGLTDRFMYVGEPDRTTKIAFLQSLDLFCLPTVYRESKGLSVLEAWANAVPAVLPAHGAFPEMLADTGGGIAFEPNDPQSLATALKRMLLDRAMADECGWRAKAAMFDRYHAQRMAERMIDIYKGVLGHKSRTP